MIIHPPKPARDLRPGDVVLLPGQPPRVVWDMQLYRDHLGAIHASLFVEGLGLIAIAGDLGTPFVTATLEESDAIGNLLAGGFDVHPT